METSRQRGRPRTFDKQAALEAAMDLFWRHGYEGTSISDLTQATGCTPPTLYAAFGSKEQLYRDVLSFYQKRGEPGTPVVRKFGTAYEQLAFYLHRLADRFTDPDGPAGCMVQTASLNCASENESARSAAAAVRAAKLGLLHAQIEDAKTHGEVPDETDTMALARFYQATIQGMSVQAIDGASADDLHHLADLALQAWPGERVEP